MTLSSLDNEVIFKKAFTDKAVFTGFVRDILGIEVEVDKIETEKKIEPKIGQIGLRVRHFAETIDNELLLKFSVSNTTVRLPSTISTDFYTIS